MLLSEQTPTCPAGKPLGMVPALRHAHTLACSGGELHVPFLFCVFGMNSLVGSEDHTFFDADSPSAGSASHDCFSSQCPLPQQCTPWADRTSGEISFLPLLSFLESCLGHQTRKCMKTSMWMLVYNAPEEVEENSTLCHPVPRKKERKER